MNMKITFLFTLVLFSSIVFAQHPIDNMSVPTYNGSSTNLSAIQKIQEIKDKTQLFLATKISPEFIKKILKPGDSIDFNYEIVIDKNGHPIPNKTKVNTTNTYFNNKIIRFLNILPKFTPAVASVTDVPYQYLNNMDIGFCLHDAYNLIPIYRVNLQERYNIDTDNEKVISLYDSINKNTAYNKPIKNIVYFSTSNDKKILNIKVFTNNLDLKRTIISSVQSIESNNKDIYSKLKANKNYTLNSSIQKKGPERVAIYPGCDENLSNKKINMCLAEKIAILINKNFNTDLAANVGLNGKQKILVRFKIDTNGNVVEARARAHHPLLREEAIRVIKLIPKMKPATQLGKPIISSFSLPIIFSVEDEAPKRDLFNHRNSRRY